MFNKKAQAAMEFLMTYGWAILVVLVAIGALAYFGVLDPDRFLPEQCTGPAGLECIDKAAILATGAADVNYIEFTLKNNLGNPITVHDASNAAAYSADIETTGNICTSVSDGTTANHLRASTNTNGQAPGVHLDVDGNGMAVQNGDLFKIRVFCGQDFQEGRFKGDVKFVYTNDATGIDHTASVNIVGRGVDLG